MHLSMWKCFEMSTCVSHEAKKIKRRNSLIPRFDDESLSSAWTLLSCLCLCLWWRGRRRKTFVLLNKHRINQVCWRYSISPCAFSFLHQQNLRVRVRTADVQVFLSFLFRSISLSFSLSPPLPFALSIVVLSPYTHKGHPRWRREQLVVASSPSSSSFSLLRKREREEREWRRKRKHWTLTRARNRRHSFLVYFSFVLLSLSYFLLRIHSIFSSFNPPLVICSVSSVDWSSYKEKIHFPNHSFFSIRTETNTVVIRFWLLF